MKVDFSSTKWFSVLVTALLIVVALKMLMLFWDVLKSDTSPFMTLLIIGVPTSFIAVSAWYIYYSSRQRKSDINQVLSKVGSGLKAVEQKLELLLANAAPRVLNKGLPPQLTLNRRKALRYFSASLLTLFAIMGVAAALRSGNLSGLVIGLAPFVVFLTFQSRKVPATISVDANGIRIDHLQKPWSEILDLKQVNSASNGFHVIELTWTKAGLSKFSWSAIQTGGVRLNLYAYRCPYGNSEEVFACMKIWHHRALRQASEARTKAKMDTKFAKLEQLMHDDPKALEVEMEKEQTEMEGLLKDLEQKRAALSR